MSEYNISDMCHTAPLGSCDVIMMTTGESLVMLVRTQMEMLFPSVTLYAAISKNTAKSAKGDNMYTIRMLLERKINQRSVSTETHNLD